MVQIRPYLSDSSSAMNSPEGSNSGTNVANSGLAAAQQTTSNLSAEITEKMRLLENIQKQLRTYQVNLIPSSLKKMEECFSVDLVLYF